MSDTGHLLELKDVSQVYQTPERPFTAVENVNLSINEGEFVCLLGPSGCGKSTLLRIATGLQKPTKGDVLYRNERLRGVNPHATIVFQSFALFPWLTVQENVEVPLKARGMSSKLTVGRAIDLLDRVGLDGFETAYPRELSGGMRQKVGFARAMALEPEILCLDEPFSALDVLSADALRGELLELWTSGSIPTRAILMVTHNIEEAVLMGDRILLMDKEPGRLTSKMKIPFTHPRQRKSAPFINMVDRVYATLAGRTMPEHVEMGTAPGEPGRTRALPHININDLASFLEHIAAHPEDRHDIYRITEDLKVDSENILRLTETSELLGFATIAEGDITLTPLGEAFAEASILARKEIFATRIRRLPFFKWLISLLRAADKQRLNWDVAQTALELEFPTQEAERQIETAVNWGRYAELLSYDDDSEMVYLEPGAA